MDGEAANVNAPAVQAAIADLNGVAAKTEGLGQPITVESNPRKTLATAEIPLAGDGTDGVSEAALARLRDDVVPPTIGRTAGTKANVTGMTAGPKDFNDTMKSHLPLVFGFMLGLLGFHSIGGITSWLPLLLFVILIDATIVRAVLLPATMKLLGEWNWYLPSGLKWLPAVRHESAPTRDEPVREPVRA